MTILNSFYCIFTNIHINYHLCDGFSDKLVPYRSIYFKG